MNPNSTSTTIRSTSTEVIIEFVYGSKNVAQCDMPSIKACYGEQNVSIEGKVVTVKIPVQQINKNACMDNLGGQVHATFFVYFFAIFFAIYSDNFYPN